MKVSIAAVMLMSLAQAQYFQTDFRRMQGGNLTAEEAELLLALNGTNATSSEDIITASYPTDLLTREQIKNGGFVIYLFGTPF